MQVVDPHIHLWNPQTHHYPWIAKPGRTFMGDYGAITGKHEVSEFLADAGEIEVLKAVHVEAAHDPADPLAETAWLQSLAREPASHGIPHGIVAAANLADPDVESLLAAMPCIQTSGESGRSSTCIPTRSTTMSAAISCVNRNGGRASSF